MVPAHIGIPFNWLSDYEKFEAPDPADWTARGYAVVNIDARGSWDSEGDMRYPCPRLLCGVTSLTTVTDGLALMKGKMGMILWNMLRSYPGAMAAFAWRETLGLELASGLQLLSNLRP